MIGLVYSPHFAMGFPGLRYLHPFDSYRARRAYNVLAQHLGLPRRGLSPGASQNFGNLRLCAPTHRVSDTELELVHSPEYLRTTRRSMTIATAVEVPPFALAPRWFLDWSLVNPMRWAVSGTLLAAHLALEHGLAFSLTGGFHHAKPNRGEGFCIFNDIAWTICSLKNEGRIYNAVYVDLDAHQGNGVSVAFLRDPSIRIFDMFNGSIYPYEEEYVRRRLDVCLPLKPDTSDATYLALLKEYLPTFLDESEGAHLLIYNAGNDVVQQDPLGGLALSPGGILERDRFVIAEARRRRIPLVFLPSGGYTIGSYRLIADTILDIVARYSTEQTA